MDLSTKAVWPESTVLIETAVGGLVPGGWDNTDGLPEVVDTYGTEEVQGVNKYMYLCMYKYLYVFKQMCICTYT